MTATRTPPKSTGKRAVATPTASTRTASTRTASTRTASTRTASTRTASAPTAKPRAAQSRTGSTRTAPTRTAPARTAAARTNTARSAQSRTAQSRTASGRRSTRPAKQRWHLPLKARLALPLVLICLLGIVLVVRVVWVSVVNADTFIESARERRELTLEPKELRGSILDRNGQALVMSVPSKLIAADPQVVKDSEATATELAALLNVPRESLVNALERPDTAYSIVARQVSPEIADKIAAKKLRGIIIDPDPTRVAVNGDLARSVLGSAPRYADDEDEKARLGIEQLFDDELKPVTGKEVVERGIGGSTIPGSERLIRTATPGADVTLTIDRSVQFMAEKALTSQVRSVGALGGTVVVGNPKTGEILAMASAARRDGKLDGEVILGAQNQAVRLYEPGSVMKLVTVATAIDQGLVTPQTEFVVPPEIVLYDRKVRDAHKHPTKKMTVEQILAESSNVGTIKIAQRIEQANGVKSIIKSLRSFGFGSTTALGLPKEQAGVVKPLWNGTDIASIPIGQSITASPIQVWAAYNVIANAGLYVPPKLVRDVIDHEGRHALPSSPSPHRVVSPSTARMVSTSLEKVVEEGTGKEFEIPGFHIAAKTGTAYKVINGSYGTEATRKYAASFVGYFPASDPQITIMVMIDEPARGQHYGATAAGPVFDALARETMRRYAIAGDDEPSGTQSKPVRSKAAQRPAPPTTAPPTTVAAPAPDGAATATPAATPATPAAPPVAATTAAGQPPGNG